MTMVLPHLQKEYVLWLPGADSVCGLGVTSRSDCWSASKLAGEPSLSLEAEDSVF
jgi:hypothetical protein